MSIENQAAFYLRNVCDYEPSIKSESRGLFFNITTVEEVKVICDIVRKILF